MFSHYSCHTPPFEQLDRKRCLVQRIPHWAKHVEKKIRKDPIVFVIRKNEREKARYCFEHINHYLYDCDKAIQRLVPDRKISAKYYLKAYTEQNILADSYERIPYICYITLYYNRYGQFFMKTVEYWEKGIHYRGIDIVPFYCSSDPFSKF